MDMETTMMKWRNQGLFKAGNFRMMEIHNRDGGGFVWWSILIIPATREAEANGSKVQVLAAWCVLALK